MSDYPEDAKAFPTSSSWEEDKLTRIIKAREQRINELLEKIDELVAANERLNGVIIGDDKLISELRTQLDDVGSEVKRLRNQGDKLEEDVKYWTEAYTCQSAQRSAEQEAFLRVIKVLAGRD